MPDSKVPSSLSNELDDLFNKRNKSGERISMKQALHQERLLEEMLKSITYQDQTKREDANDKV